MKLARDQASLGQREAGLKGQGHAGSRAICPTFAPRASFLCPVAYMAGEIGQETGIDLSDLIVASKPKRH
jgi:hypothetical protein